MSTQPARAAPAARAAQAPAHGQARRPAAVRLAAAERGPTAGSNFAGGNLAAQHRPGPAAPVQMKCAACAAGGAPCPRCEEEARQAVQQRAADTVQLWDCTEYGEPTCVQTRSAEPPPVQARCAACEEEQGVQREGDGDSHGRPDAAVIRREAGKGLATATAPLPHAERIQAAFGHHDLSDVRTAVGGPAESASRRMGALAFASGNRIAFREEPGLHLAAHEAAHVIQQRAGLRLPGNVGQAGDAWERHADSVADAVVAGRSAEPLLDQVARPGGAKPAAGSVQHRLTTAPTRTVEAPAPPPRVAPERKPGAAAGEGAGDKGAPEGAPGKDAKGSALDAAGAGDAEAPPEGVAKPAAAAPGGAGGEGAAPQGGAPRPPPPAAGGAIEAPCYNVDPPPRPDKTDEPKQDNKSTESKEEERVTFDPWQDLPDNCPAEGAMAQAGAPPAGAALAGAAAGAAGGAAGATAAPAAKAGAAAQQGKDKGKGKEKKAGGAGAAELEAEQAAPPAGMEGEIAGAEGQRDTAVGDYEVAAAALAEVDGNSGALLGGLAFSGGAGNDAAREAAIGQTRAFLDDAAEQIAAATAFGLRSLPARLGSLADGVNANIAAAIELEKAAISERIVASRVRAMGAAQAARAHVQAEYAASIATVGAETDAALGTLDETYAASQQQTDEKETAGLADVNNRFAAGRTRHEQKGPQYAQRALRRGQEHAKQYERCKVHPKSGVNYDDDGFWDGCLTVRRARAQQDTACKTAAGYRKAFLRTANKKGYDLIELRKVYRCAVIAGARQVNGTLDDVYDKVADGLESGRAQALTGLALARDENLKAIDKALAGQLAALAAQEAAQRQAADDTGYMKQLAVEQLAHSGAANLIRGVTAASASLQRVLGTIRDQLAAGGVPDPDWLALTLGTLRTALGGGMGTLMARMEEGAQGAERSLVDLGMASLRALQMVTEGNAAQCAGAEGGFAAQMKGTMAGATGVFAQLTNGHVENVHASTAQAVAGMKQAVTGFGTALGTIGEKVDGAIGKSVDELVKDLDGKIAELDGQIAREAWKAASKEQPAWKKVLAIVLIVLVIIAAAVISIVTLGAGASLFAVILVGALVGAVSAGLIQILNNWASGESWHEGLVTAMVMGAIGGAIGGGLGFAGGALASGAAAAGARVATQFAIQVGADLLAEGVTQTIGYVAFGQEFNWQGFLMAGVMSSVSFKAHPVAPHPAAPHPATPHVTPTPHGAAAPHGGAPHGATPEVPRPHVPEPAAPRPAHAGAPGAGAAAARHGAVKQIAGGALIGFAAEGISAWLSGEKFDPSRAASAAAGAAVSARASRMGHGAAPREEPTTRLGRAAERVRTFDPGDAGARLGKRLEGAGARMFGAAEAGVPGAPRPRAEEPALAGPRTEEPDQAPRGRAATEGTETAPGRAAGEPEPRAAREGPDSPPSRDRPTAELEDSTHAAVRVGDEDHDVYFTRRGGHIECDVCSFGCGNIRRRIERMQEALPNTREGRRLRRRLQAIHDRVAAVETGIERATMSHRDVTDASAQIADSLHALGADDPRLGAAIGDPQLFERLYDGDDAGPHGLPLVRTDDLGAGTAARRTVDIGDDPGFKLRDGTPLLYVLRDKTSGAILKVGRTNLGSPADARFERYRFAGEMLDLDLAIEITPVTKLRGRSISDYESDLRARVEAAGHILPWDYTRVMGSGGMGRLGRVGPGTPFEPLPSSGSSTLRAKGYRWERRDVPRKGYLLPGGRNAPPPPVRGKIQLEPLRKMVREGWSNQEIAEHFGVPEASVRRAKSVWRGKIDEDG